MGLQGYHSVMEVGKHVDPVVKELLGCPCGHPTRRRLPTASANRKEAAGTQCICARRHRREARQRNPPYDARATFKSMISTYHREALIPLEVEEMGRPASGTRAPCSWPRGSPRTAPRDGGQEDTSRTTLVSVCALQGVTTTSARRMVATEPSRTLRSSSTTSFRTFKGWTVQRNQPARHLLRARPIEGRANNALAALKAPSEPLVRPGRAPRRTRCAGSAGTCRPGRRGAARSRPRRAARRSARASSGCRRCRRSAAARPR